MPLAMARNSAGKGTKECSTIRPMEPITPHMPQDMIVSSMCWTENS
jgi:hypothetical protein